MVISATAQTLPNDFDNLSAVNMPVTNDISSFYTQSRRMNDGRFTKAIDNDFAHAGVEFVVYNLFA
jgi:hypothetical protein